MRVALIEPEIPQNTGSIGRLCAGTKTPLHLVGKLGFSLSDRHLRRAGLDYWPSVELYRHNDIASWLDVVGSQPLWAMSRHATLDYTDVPFGPDDWLVFGCESVGLPESLRRRFADRLLRIPIAAPLRSFNLSNAVAIVLFEALRQRRLTTP